MEQGLFIKSDSGNNYFYDDRTGFINPIEGKWNREVYEKKYKDIIKSSSNINLIEPSKENIKKYLFDEAQGFRQLILEVTSGCNLRCKYCIYSEHYPTYKGYEDKFMDFETSKKAIDLYMQNYRKIKYINPTRKANIGFYGGEPLLNFELIKKIVSYCKETYEENILYNITSNGLLFTEEIQKFLVENDFSIIISLDGNKENHDRNRVKIDGTGSFDKVMENINLFKKTYPNYDKLAISTCYDFKTDLFELQKFFDDEKLFIAKLALIESTNTNYYNQFTKEDVEKYLHNNEKFEEKFSDICRDGIIDKKSFLYSYIGLNYSQFAFHSIYNETRPAILPYTGTCVPGEKIYVTIDGKIHICEKINSNYSIGNVNMGLDYNKIIKIINNYNEVTKNRCKNCNVKRFCNICFSQCSTEGEYFKKDFKECKRIEENVRDTMTKYISLLEKNPHLFEDITVEYFGEIYKKVGDSIEL
ncbi:radical SAM protein [uncultured Clostridium sp.]|uniref:radical SAM protein n=1 Tax=uncultured Clostridium sp. TaxID=59620 RepID=UPI0025D42186|nr:radical SAM protein [uncultured Clostridium sp.]